MRTRLTTSILALTLLTAAAGVAGAQHFQGPPPPPYQDHDRGGWDAPPPEFAAAQQRGFRDGVDGARRDFDNHRRPDVNNRDEFRNPRFIAPPDRHSYREGFRRGYDVAVHHIYGNRR
jgi:hypothetical protein